MQYEFRSKSLASVVSKAVANRPDERLSKKGSDGDSATIRSGNSARLAISVKPGETYSVDWSARSENEDVYSIKIFTDVGLGSRQEAFSADGSWRFRTGNYEGAVTIVVEFLYAFSALRYLDVSVS